jgi:hypothetical protein
MGCVEPDHERQAILRRAGISILRWSYVRLCAIIDVSGLNRSHLESTIAIMISLRLSSSLLFCVLLATGCASLSKSTRTSAEPTAEDSARLIVALTDLAGTDVTRLHPHYVRETLKDCGENEPLNSLFLEALADGSEASLLALIEALERQFIHDTNTSALDLLGPELSEHFREFDWQYGDFPGGPEGPNEQFADVMVDVLDLICPERRANQGLVGVVWRSEATPEVWGYITNCWAPVPGQEKRKLNTHALESFIRMREAAKADGVDLIILSAHRDPAAARANAARAGNSNAVASFSSHSLGLAIDFEMSHRDQIQFKGISTRPMSELVRMRESPVHKWLVLRGEQFGWYPYQNEPWHWEYNPPGFREIYWAEFPSGAPHRDPFEVAP